MTVNLRDLPDVFDTADVRYVLEPGWETRGTGGSFAAESLMLHHDASAPGSSSGSADYIIANLLSQLWLDYEGIWHLIATGRMNHAGKGSWPGVPTNDANATFVGIETDHTTNEQWTSGQRQNGLRGLLAMAKWMGIRGSADELYRHLIAHKEWAPTRKVDPDPLDMDDLRALILNPPDLEDGPVFRISKGNDDEQRLDADVWNRLRLTSADKDDTGLWAVGPGPAGWWMLTVHLIAKGPVGAQVSVRAYREDDAGVRSVVYPMVTDPIPNGGILRLGYAAQGSVEDGEWLRVEARCNADGLVDEVTTRCAMWE